MTYTARLNEKITLPSGNWFTGFRANVETRTVVYTYHDHRRNGQVARHYTVTFKSDLYTIESVTAVSAHGGRIEHFKTVSIRDELAGIIRAQVVKFEQGFLVEVEQKKEKFDLEAFLSGLFIILALIEVITCVSLFVIPEGTGLFELISAMFLTSSVGALIVGLFAVHKSIC